MRWRWRWCQKAEEEEEERGISSWEKGEKSLPLFTTVACAGREEDERRRKRGFWHQRAKPTRGKSLRDRCCTPCTRGFETLVCLCSSKGGNFLHQINDDANLRQTGREKIDIKFGSASILQINDDANFYPPPTKAVLLLSQCHISNPEIHP